jgi:hypothetical protein
LRKKHKKIKWNRNNIAATMEKYEPTTVKSHSHSRRGHVTLSHQKQLQQQQQQQQHPQHYPMHSGDYLNEIHQMDYAYAYYEPGAPMRHQNIPDYYEEAGPSRAPPPNSIRALLSTARRNQLQRTSGKYSLPPSSTSQRSHENVYEEIHDKERGRMRAGESLASLDQNLEDELRRVQTQHHQTLGQLRLDVEEMLMPAVMPPQTNVNFIQATPKLEPSSDPMDFLGNGEVNDVSNGAGNSNLSGSNYINNNIINNLDLDSGFSGSNSSYIGSLRYQKTNAAALNNGVHCKAPTHSTQLPINHQHTDSGSSSFYGGSSSSATDEIGMISLCRSSSSLYDSGKKQSKSSPVAAGRFQQQQHQHHSGSEKSDRVSFWKSKGRGWISKLPGFSSTSSINKVGMGEYLSLERIPSHCSLSFLN